MWYPPLMIRTSHVIAAFVGVVFAGWLQWMEPLPDPPMPVVVVAWFSVLFGLLWECAIRLWRIVDSLMRRQNTGKR